jgi:hypothetical protein
VSHQKRDSISQGEFTSKNPKWKRQMRKAFGAEDEMKILLMDGKWHFSVLDDIGLDCGHNRQNAHELQESPLSLQLIMTIHSIAPLT